MASTADNFSSSEVLDLIIVGTGISGINTAYRVQSELPGARFTIVEGRDSIGGTWDQFRYPGIRSDSALQTYSFAWHPWPYSSVIVEGPLIMEYLQTCVSQYGIDRHIQFKHRVVSMNWSSKEQLWTLAVSHDGLAKEFKTRFVVLGTGYYDYETPRQTMIPGIEDFKGTVIHPQFWPDDFDHTGQRMVIIGSGATAFTLVPNLVEKAASVTMVQRSPTYAISLPKHGSAVPPWLRQYERMWHLLVGYLFVQFCKYFPTRMRDRLHQSIVQHLPARISVDPHFSPRYQPWQQRLCFVPDGDFFKALHSPKAGIVTGHIQRVTEHAVEMQDGLSVAADVIVAATGLKVQLGGKIAIHVDGGGAIVWRDRVIWNSAMVHNVPNLLFVRGYVDAPWTAGADNAAFILVRLLRLMRARGAAVVVPRLPPAVEKAPRARYWDLESTYLREADERLPRYGSVGPWRPMTNPLVDYVRARWGNITRDLDFSR